MREQIKDSKTMEEDQKRVACESIDGLLSCTNPEILHRPIAEFSGHFGRDKLVVLNMFSISLRLENSEPTLSDDDAKQIVEEIDELGLFVAKANIDSDLRKLLLTHLAYMAWAVRSIRLIGADGVYEAFGPAVLTARRIARSREEDQDDPEKTPRAAIYNRLAKIANKVISLLEFTDKGLQAIDHISDDIQGLLP